MAAEKRDVARLRRWVPHLPLAAWTAGLAVYTVGRILERAGRPAAPLDDTYIHFQYARAIAEAHPFRYTPGAVPTPGATSLAWPVLLAPFHLLGLHREALLWAAWGFGFVALALTAHETHRLAAGLLPRGAAVAAGAMVAVFGGFAWFAGSGMEVVPFAWLLTRAVRRSAEWVESATPESTAGADAPTRRELLVLAVLSPLMRPEGALASLVAVAALLARRPRKGWDAALALASPALPSLVCLLATGHAIQSTAAAKWLPLNPYYGGERLPYAVVANVRLFFETLLDGRLWTSVFLPSGGRLVAAAALLALPVVGVLRGRTVRAVFALALALGALVPATYETFLVNRVRYIWPFAPGWFVALAALSHLVGSALAWPLARVPRMKREYGGAALAWAAVLSLASKLSWSIDDLAESARAVTLQQVSLAEWARTALPKDATLGVNDTGALAYFSDRATFDVVGLTTSGEARYWTAGPGSRFEHYERLPRAALPTHFVVYREWMAVEPVLGTELAERSVRHTILGGETMAAFTADYAMLGTGERPEREPPGRLVDACDVADLESEARHGYALHDATKEQNFVLSTALRADGGRQGRHLETFSLRLAGRGHLVARLGADGPVAVRATIDGRPLGVAELDGAAWQEIELAVPPDVAGGEHRVELASAKTAFAAYHYWSYE